MIFDRFESEIVMKFQSFFRGINNRFDETFAKKVPSYIFLWKKCNDIKHEILRLNSISIFRNLETPRQRYTVILTHRWTSAFVRVYVLSVTNAAKDHRPSTRVCERSK